MSGDGDREPIDAEYEPAGRPTSRSAPPRPRAAGGAGAQGLGAALGLTLVAAGAGALAGALAPRAPGVPQLVDTLLPNELTQVRTSQAAADAQLAEIRANGGLTPAARAELEAARASLQTIEQRLAAWDAGLRLLPNGPQEFEPLRRRLEAIESLPADPSATTPAQIARNAAALNARLKTLEESTAGALAYNAAAAQVDPVLLGQRLDGLNRDLVALSQRLDSSATASELQALSAEFKAAQERLAGIALEATRAGEAARGAFALAAVSDAARGSAPFIQAHAALQAALPNDPNVAALAPLARTGAPSQAQLVEEFRVIELDLARAARSNVAGGGAWGAVQGALSPYVLVRKVGETETTDDIVARASGRLTAGNLEGAVQDVARLGGDARTRAAPWLARARQRLDLDQRLGAIRAELARGAAAQ